MFFQRHPLNSLNNLPFGSKFYKNVRKICNFSSIFSAKLLLWYHNNKRNLPWRESKNVYIIWLSEVILQQTRVAQGLPYFIKFVENFPTVKDLAEASQDEVFKLWQGLGYYNRARNLHATAKQITSEYGGVFPTEYKDIIALKGVGEYTAAAIMSFAYNEPYAAVDGNVYRVLSRVFGVDDYIDTSTGKKVFQELATALLDKENAGLHNQAIMDFGSLQCVPSSPDCLPCPFKEECIACNSNTISELPRKKGKVVVRARYFNYFDICVEDSFFLKKRVDNDIWKGLYEFALIETGEKLSFDQLSETEEYGKLFSSSKQISVVSEVSYKHILSHQIIHATFYGVEVDNFDSSDFLRGEREELNKYGVSRLTQKYLNDEL